jgi:hypothetical protein
MYSTEIGALLTTGSVMEKIRSADSVAAYEFGFPLLNGCYMYAP